VISDPYRQLTPEQVERFDDYVERRSRREPVARILGRKGFWKLLLRVGPEVLTPRPETERVVDIALEAFPERSGFHMLDLGVGSGAILLSVLAERPAAKGMGVDVSEDALATARDNAASLGLGERAAFLRTDWTQGLPATSRGWSRRSRRTSPGWRSTAGRTGWTATACWRRRSCGCSSPAACSPSRSAGTRRRR
jgi:release factor glutamine methyltransferase